MFLVHAAHSAVLQAANVRGNAVVRGHPLSGRDLLLKSQHPHVEVGS